MKKSDLSKKLWNSFYTLLFISTTIFAWHIMRNHNIKIEELQIIDFIIIALATYRMTRLLIYDEIFSYLREFITKSKKETGFIQSTSFFLTCPWCVSIWMALFSISCYVLFPYGKMLVILFSVAALSNIFHVFISLLGWVSDERKIVSKKLKEDLNNGKKVDLYQ